MTSHRERISEEAALWVQRLEHEGSPDCHAALDRWLRQSAMHVEEFMLAKATWAELDGLDSSFPVPDADGQKGLVLAFSRPKERLASRQSVTRNEAAPHHRRFAHRYAGIAAGVAAVVAGWWLVTTLAPSAEVYATRVGDQKSIALSDGSVLDLNTESRARVQFSAGGRDVLLLEGEALFTVAHDANRPFRVHSGDVVVQAIGTRFNVYRTGETTKVAVVEGVVQLSAGSGSGEESRGGARLAAGEEAQVAHGRIVKTPTPDIHRAVAWKARQLVFQGDRVEDVVREFNRYSARPIRVEGETIRARRMSGVFDANDPSPLIQFLSRNPDVEVVRSEKEVLIRPRG